MGKHDRHGGARLVIGRRWVHEALEGLPDAIGFAAALRSQGPDARLDALAREIEDEAARRGWIHEVAVEQAMIDGGIGVADVRRYRESSRSIGSSSPGDSMGEAAAYLAGQSHAHRRVVIGDVIGMRGCDV